MQEHPLQAGTIVRAVASTDVPELGIKQGGFFYLARDGHTQSFWVVKWDRVRWICSCGKGACEHKLAVNTFVFEESHKRLGSPHDLVSRTEDEA